MYSEKPANGIKFCTVKQCNNAHEPHSLDEVAGSFVREALFPSSWQIYNTEKNTFNDPPQTENTLQGKKCPPRCPADQIVCRVPDRIMCPELTGSPVRGCSQVVLRVLSLQERHLLLNDNNTTKKILRVNNGS